MRPHQSDSVSDSAKLALSTCPKTSWEARVCYDHDAQRLAFESMKRQLLDEAYAARGENLRDAYSVGTNWKMAWFSQFTGLFS